MKIFLTTTLAFSTICILEANQPAEATFKNDANFHLTRGGGRGGEARRAPIERSEEETSGYRGEGRNEDGSSEPHTSESSRVEDHVHTPMDGGIGEGPGKDISSEPHTGTVTDEGRVHTLPNDWRRDGWGDWGGECPSGNVDAAGNCIPLTEGTSSGENSSGWTTVQ